MTKQNRAYLIGCGGHAKVVAATLVDAGFEVAGVFDDDASRCGTTFAGAPVVGPIARVKEGEPFPAVLAIGNNRVRRRLALELELDWLTVVHSRATVHSSVVLGRGTVVFAGAVIQPDACLGDHIIVNTSASIDHDSRVGDFAHVAPGVRLAGGVSIGQGAFLGIGSAVAPAVHVGEWATVGAGAAVVQDVPPETTVVGVPARCISDRSEKRIFPGKREPRRFSA